MADEDPNKPDPDFVAVYDGVVVDRLDKKRIGRCKVRVPGLLEPGAWALPTATVGGGDNQRGFFAVPEVGAEVSVWFKMGDPDVPRYVAGPWGCPEGKSQIPRGARQEDDGTEIPFEEVPNIRVIEFKRFEMIFDEREGKERFIIRDKDSPGEDFIEIDAVAGGIQIVGTAAIRIATTGNLDLEGLNVRINGRVVKPSPDPI